MSDKNNVTKDIECDLLVVGGGCGGFATALRAARNTDMNVVLLEKENILGGNSTLGGVNCWEPGISGESGLHYELAEKLLNRHNAAGVGKTVHFYKGNEPFGFSEISSELTYKSSTKRAGLNGEELRRFHFEPYIMAHEMNSMLLDAGVRIMYSTSLIDVEYLEDKIISILCQKNMQKIKISAKYFADCTGDIVLCQMTNCESTLGEESYNHYKELGAPIDATKSLNGATLVFRVTPTLMDTIDELPNWIKDTNAHEWMKKSEKLGCSINKYPNGDLNMNILPVVQGKEYHSANKDYIMKEALARVLLYWNYYQLEMGFSKYTLKYIFPIIGVREGRRLVGRYVLDANDIANDYTAQNNKNTIIAFSDHPVDVHSKSHQKIYELKVPYGVPYECLLPKEFNNLIVACRGASFSHIAGASCRLNRTMLACGEAAGYATKLAINNHIGYDEIDIEKLKEELKIQDTIKWIENNH